MSLTSNTEAKIIKRSIIILLISSGIILMSFPSPKEYIYGLVFGTSINLLNFRLMSLTLKKSVKLPQSQVMPYVVANYLVRYVIYGIVLAIGAVADYISLLYVILGFFMVKFVIISDTFYDIIINRRKNHKI